MAFRLPARVATASVSTWTRGRHNVLGRVTPCSARCGRRVVVRGILGEHPAERVSPKISIRSVSSHRELNAGRLAKQLRPQAGRDLDHLDSRIRQHRDVLVSVALVAVPVADGLPETSKERHPGGGSGRRKPFHRSRRRPPELFWSHSPRGRISCRTSCSDRWDRCGQHPRSHRRLCRKPSPGAPEQRASSAGEAS
jgi:hypothetical protein